MKEELKRIWGGYKPLSNAWYYQILFGVSKFVSIIVMSIKNLRRASFRYACPNCGKESNDSDIIFQCIYNHEYNKGENK